MTTNLFNARSTTDEVLSGVSLQSKRILVTGVSAGLGVETARVLAAHGAHVVGAARDLAKAEKERPPPYGQELWLRPTRLAPGTVRTVMSVRSFRTTALLPPSAKEFAVMRWIPLQQRDCGKRVKSLLAKSSKDFISVDPDTKCDLFFGVQLVPNVRRNLRKFA